MWLNGLRRRVAVQEQQQVTAKRRRSNARQFHPRVETLEDRLAPATLTVNSLNDGPVSEATSTLTLREAIA